MRVNLTRNRSDDGNNHDCKDNSSYNGGVLSKTYGTWAPQLTGSATLKIANLFEARADIRIDGKMSGAPLSLTMGIDNLEAFLGVNRLGLALEEGSLGAVLTGHGLALKGTGRLTEADGRAVVREATSVVAIAPFLSTQAQIVWGDRNVATSVVGSSFMPVSTWPPLRELAPHPMHSRSSTTTVAPARAASSNSRQGPISVQWFKGGTTNICYNALDR